tara:strand:+ start:20626 stop:21762 length:1137 start_codon:yes stop_codon:yes gene_type:complete
MKITIKRTEDQLALIRAMGSNNREEAYEAQAAVAELLGPVVSEVINNAPTIGNLYTTISYGEDDNPSLPLDLFHDITDEDYIEVYSQQVAGGLPYSQVFPAHNELKFTTYNLDSALAFDRKYVRKARLDVVSKTFTRMAQEVLLKQTTTAFNVLATALVKGTGTGSTAGGSIIASDTENRFVLADFNNLITLSKRMNSSFSGGTPVGGIKSGITDLLVSPEMTEELRAMAYNPINTAAAPAGGTPADGQMAPEALRQELFSAAGLPSFYGINITEVNEMGVNQRFNKLFAAVVTSEGATVAGGGGGTFSQAADEILIGVDRAKEALIRPVVVGEGSPSELQVLVDDQFSVRQNKIGYYGKVEEGRICINNKALVGLAV